jgi:lactoylglutathione lyase
MMKVDYGSAVFVRNLGEAREFYEKLGFIVQNEDTKPKVSWLEVALPDGYGPIALVAFEETTQFEARIGGHTGLVFVTDDIDGTCKTLKEKDVQFEYDPVSRPWGGSDAQFMDQDKNKILLVERDGELTNDEGMVVLRSHRPTE